MSATLPNFVETFLDNGYMDMYKVMKALVEVKFDGIAIPDHIPGMGRPATPVGAPAEGARAGARTGGAANSRAGAGLAYSIAYMRALLNAAQASKA